MRKILPSKSSNDWLRPGEDRALLNCEGSLQERFLVALLPWGVWGAKIRFRLQMSTFPGTDPNFDTPHGAASPQLVNDLA
jgi:hypothetical protein